LVNGLGKKLIKKLFFVVLALALIAGSAGYSANMVWTNAVNGHWRDTTSMNPNQIPGASADAIITYQLYEAKSIRFVSVTVPRFGCARGHVHPVTQRGEQ
jgi:hypothetical protein